MKTIIFSITALFGLFMQTNAQVGGMPTPPPTLATPQVEAYSNSSSKNFSRSTVTTRHKSTKNGKTEEFTESYTISSPQQGQYDDPQKTKSFSKSYSIGKGDKVNISNIYGSAGSLI
ncbi:MAG: hypothetical protein EOO07_15725, partial [Chitinophagaceae bacterium]